jgi:hypothetical protein
LLLATLNQQNEQDYSLDIYIMTLNIQCYILISISKERIFLSAAICCTARTEKDKKFLYGHIAHKYDRHTVNAGYIMIKLESYGRLYFMPEITQT